MAGFSSKIRLRTAQKNKNKFDLSCDHITTSDFMRCLPVYFKPIVPGESWRCNMQTFTRLAPLVNPMYGRCRIINRAFFVPMRTIFYHWNEFITDVPVDNTYLKVPRIKLSALANALHENSYVVQNTSVYDYKYDNANYNLSYQGRIMWTLLQTLGYRFSIGYYVNSSSTDVVSALPLLAFVKIYKDWYRSMQYTNIDEYIPDSLFRISVDTSSGDPYLTNLSDILGVITTAIYDQDYFTSAWDRPVAPNSGLESANTFRDVTNDKSTAASSAASWVSNAASSGSTNPTTPTIKGSASSGNDYNSGGAPMNISQYVIDVLKHLTDYLKRHQLVGGQAMDRMLARFGMKPSDAALNRSVYLGKDEVNIQIADVMSTSNGEVQIEGLRNSKTIVGDYAGKGVGFSDNGHFKLDSNEYGFVIIVSSLLPKVGYVQGMNRNVLHLDRLDFFTPEFDALGVQAIARKELLSAYLGASQSKLVSLTPAVALDGVFGYTSRYAEYKQGCIYDNMTGNFSVPHLNADSTIGSVNSSWHLNRLIDANSVNDTYKITHNYGFVTATDAYQYDRVFSIPGVTGSDNDVTVDHFINIYHFNVESYLPMSPLFDDYKFDGGSNDVTMDINGTQLN